MRALLDTENIFIEPSACAAFAGPVNLLNYEETRKYIAENQLGHKMNKATHIVWATGGSLVPEEEREIYRKTFLD